MFETSAMWPKLCHITNRCFEPHDKKNLSQIYRFTKNIN